MLGKTQQERRSSIHREAHRPGGKDDALVCKAHRAPGSSERQGAPKLLPSDQVWSPDHL